MQPNVFSKHKLEDLSICITNVEDYSVDKLKRAFFRIVDLKGKSVLSVSGFGIKLEEHVFFHKTKLVELEYADLSKEATASLWKAACPSTPGSSITCVSAYTYLEALAKDMSISPNDLLVIADKYAVECNFCYIVVETDEHFALRQGLIEKYKAYIEEWAKKLSVSKAEKAKTDRLAAKVDDLESLLSGLKRAGVKQEDAVCVKIRKQLEIAKAKLQPLLESSGGTPKKTPRKK